MFALCRLGRRRAGRSLFISQHVPRPRVRSIVLHSLHTNPLSIWDQIEASEALRSIDPVVVLVSVSSMEDRALSHCERALGVWAYNVYPLVCENVLRRDSRVLWEVRFRLRLRPCDAHAVVCGSVMMYHSSGSRILGGFQVDLDYARESLDNVSPHAAFRIDRRCHCQASCRNHVLCFYSYAISFTKIIKHA